MWRGSSYFEVGPAAGQSFDGGLSGDIERVMILLIDLSEGFDQVGCVTFVAAQFSPDGMRIDCDVQGRFRSNS